MELRLPALSRMLAGVLLTVSVLLPISIVPGRAQGVSRLEQSDPAIQYSGEWYSNSGSAHTAGAAALTNTKDARATVTFTGTGITWIGHSDGWSGIAWVYLNGALTTVDTYTPADQYQRPLYSVRGLPSGTHNLTIVVPHERGPNTQGSWIWIDAFDIENGGGVVGGVSATSGRSEQSNPAITYAGIWNTHAAGFHSGGSAALAINAGSLATVTFRGTGITWLGYRDEFSGIAKVSVDGAPRGVVDTYRSPPQAQAAIFSSGVLTNGTHTLTIEVTGNRNATSGGAWIWLDAIEVAGDGAQPPPPPPVPPPPASGLTPAINSGGMVNGASLRGPVAGGSILTVFGTGFAAGPAWAASMPLPFQLNSANSSVATATTVRVNGLPAPLFYVSPTQINLQIPWETVGQGSVSISVSVTSTPAGGTTGSGSTAGSAPLSAALPEFAPGIFTAGSGGTGQGAVLIAGTPFLAASEGSASGARPADRGGFITVYATGLGAVSARPDSGAAANSGGSLSITRSTPLVSIGDVPAPVQYSGLAPGFVGLYQLNVQVPPSAPTGAQVPLTLAIGGASSNTVTIAIR